MTMTQTRFAALRQALLDHKHKQQTDVESRVREGRATHLRDVGDSLDSSDADIQSSLDLALLQMSAATLTNIDEALVRLDAGRYGSCLECGQDITERRLRALPFAVRCHDCEAEREAERGQARTAAHDRSRTTLFPQSAGF